MAAKIPISPSRRQEEDKSRVIIFSSQTCRHCKAAKTLLQSFNVDLTEIDIGSRPTERKTLASYTHMTSVPQIFIGAEFIGGNDRLQAPAGPAGPESLSQRMAAVEDAPCTAAGNFALAVLERTKLGQLSALQPGFFQSSTVYASPATVQPYMSCCVSQLAVQEAFVERGCGASAADGYTSFAVHSGLLTALNGHTKATRSCAKTWPLALHSALARWMVNGYLSPTAAASSGGASGDAAAAQGGGGGGGATQGSFDAAQQLLQPKPNLPNMIKSSLGLNASWESHIMPLVPGEERASAATSNGPPALDGQMGVPASCSEEAARAGQIADIYADALDAVMVEIAPTGDTGYVYFGLTSRPTWKTYERAAALLRRCCVPSLSNDARKALFLNVYNGLMIHGLVFWGAPATDRARWKFFSKTNYLIGGLSYSLDDVEHGVLRCNAPHPYRVQPQFAPGDLRCEAALKTLDPRVHFAMVCGAKSCPPVRVFRPAALDQELHEAAAAFCSDSGNVQADLGARTLQISRILYWFNKDFGRGSTGDVAHAYIKQYAEGEVGAALAAAARDADTVKVGLFSSASKHADKWKISFLEYDWSANGIGLMPAS